MSPQKRLPVPRLVFTRLPTLVESDREDIDLSVTKPTQESVVSVARAYMVKITKIDHLKCKAFNM